MRRPSPPSGPKRQTGFEPLAIEVVKRGRPCIVAKITFLDDQPILAIAHRNQHGTSSLISIPVCALDYAEKHGVRDLYFRRDTTAEMYRMSLSDVRKRGYLQASDGVMERFIRVENMQRVPWRKWPFAESVIRLGEKPEPTSVGQAVGPREPATKQLGFW